ncbi:MAG: PLP-dependent aminotransferase family protein [Aquidulcibacter sp.]|uniref:MocR-like transcription factor YczR n=1 Tax=Aquidulcibacter sp. TaxID=2052990 RepID=UPI0022C8C51C|nr:PLP-dependent aminotransferase family protein [Aquidulcibacter sp.]
MKKIVTSTLQQYLGRWQEHGSGPKHHRLANELRRLILDGRLALGLRIPSERELADTLGVSRTLVTAALDQLRQNGFLESRRGSGTLTTYPDWVDSRPTGHVPSDQPTMLDLSTATLGASEHVHSALTFALARLPFYLPGHGYSEFGIPELRAAVAGYYTRSGLVTHPEEILITAGAQSGFALMLRTFGGPGRSVLMEQPTYPFAIDAVMQSGCRARAIPLLPNDWDSTALLEAVRKGGDCITYLIPDHQNPTGLVMGAELRSALSAQFKGTERFLVLDETMADLWLDQPPPRFSGRVDAAGIVRIGSVSKSYWGGLRIGWLRADRRVISALARARASIDLGVSVLEQIAVVHLFNLGDQSLDNRRHTLRKMRKKALALVHEYLPDWTTIEPIGGLTMWLRMPKPIARQVSDWCLRNHLQVVPGSRFSVYGGLDSFMRLPFSRSEDDLRRGLQLLATAYSTVGTKTKGHPQNFGPY